jgi:uncharacterized membrane protein YcfT
MGQPIIVLLALLIWGAALIGLCSRRVIDVHSKISWIVILLVFNALGALVYFLFGPRAKKIPFTKPEIPEDSEPIIPEHMQSWNPITGYNSGKQGEGLNPSSNDDSKPKL